MDWAELPQDLQEVLEFHTHLCIGVVLGYKACKYAVDIIGQSEKMFVLSEKKNCGDDAVKVLFDCSVEAGTLAYGKGEGQGWSFYNHIEEDGVTLIINPNVIGQLGGGQEEAAKHLLAIPNHLVFTVTPFTMVEHALG